MNLTHRELRMILSALRVHSKAWTKSKQNIQLNIDDVMNSFYDERIKEIDDMAEKVKVEMANTTMATEWCQPEKKG